MKLRSLILTLFCLLPLAARAQGSPVFTGPTGAAAKAGDGIKLGEVTQFIGQRALVTGGYMRDPSGAFVTVEPGSQGSVNLPADGVLLRSVTIGAPNPSGFYSSATGLGIIMGCTQLSTGELDPSSCASGGINGGFGAAYPQGLQAALNYAGVDRAGLFIGGVFVPPCYGSGLNGCSAGAVTLSGPLGVRVTLPTGQAVPKQFLRAGTFVQLPGLTSPLEGMVMSWDPAGTWVQVSGWGDPTTRTVGVDATTYALASGNTQLSAIVGYSLTDFGMDVVDASMVGGAQIAKGAEFDLGCNLTTNCPFNYGVSVNGFGSQENGAGLSVNGSVGPISTEYPGGRPAFNDGLELRSFGYRGILVDMDFDGNPYHNGIAGLYVNARGNLPIVVHNPSQTANNGNVYTVDASGNINAAGSFNAASVSAASLTSTGLISAMAGLSVTGVTGASYALQVLEGSNPVLLVDGVGTLHGYGAAQFDGIVTAAGLSLPQGTITSSSYPCQVGQLFEDAAYLYMCTSANTLKHVAFTAF